jgi:proteasome lid subunit RPN8/RPN11
MGSLLSDPWFREDLLRRARAAEPNEACGVIVDEVVIVEIPNVHKEPATFFEMDPEVLLDVYEEYGTIDGVWHSHPNGDPFPSDADRAGAPPGVPYYIVAGFQVWRYDL